MTYTCCTMNSICDDAVSVVTWLFKMPPLDVPQELPRQWVTIRVVKARKIESTLHKNTSAKPWVLMILQVHVPNAQRGQTRPKHQNLEQSKVHYRAVQEDW